MARAQPAVLFLPAVVVGVAALAIFEPKLPGLATLAVGIVAGTAVMRFATTGARVAALTLTLTLALAALAIGLFILDCALYCT